MTKLLEFCFYYNFQLPTNTLQLVGCLQFIKEISTSGGIPYIFIPLALILTVSALKDFFEDLSRHASDNEENTRKTKVYRDGQFVKTKWKDLKVGDIAMVD